MRRLLLALFLPLAACKPDVTPEEQARRDAADVAAVEKAQKVRAPAQPLALQPLGEGDGAQVGLSGAGCSFAPLGVDQPVLLADMHRAIVKVADATTMLAVDVGADGAVRKYVGKVHTARIATEGSGTPSGDEGMEYAATMTMQDADKREVYRATGTLYCGA